MDLCCVDTSCVSVLDKTSGEAILDSPNSIEITRSGKNRRLKEKGQSMMNALNKFTSQIKKPPRRRSPPINWSPRQKVEPYLKRKIKLMQEVDGMSLTLEETLGDANPHYCRVKREQIAAREAAFKAMMARKSALVEASWCRILRAARIQSKEAEPLLLEAEKIAGDAFEKARVMGVIMFDLPDCPRKPCDIETSSTNGAGSSKIHTVAASFETAFDVDKDVAAAVKTAFTRLGNCLSLSKDEFKDLLRKISENPDIDETSHELTDFTSECESDNPISEFEQGIYKKENTSINLVDMMFERLKCLQEDELESLATIVATCGLNAALANIKRQSVYVDDFAKDMRNAKQNEAELPSLDKFLVKHMSKLEKEVSELKNTRKNESVKKSGDNSDNVSSTEIIPSLESILVKHSSKLEKEIEETKKNSGKMYEKRKQKGLDNDVPDLGSILIKHASKFQKEIEESKKNCGKSYETIGKKQVNVQNGVLSHEAPSLDKLLVKKHASRLEREVQEAKLNRKNDPTLSEKENIDMNKDTDEKTRKKQGGNYEGGLENVFVKRVSGLEKEKMKISSKEDDMVIKVKKNNLNMQIENNDKCGGGLDQVLVKHKSRLEREKTDAAQQPEGGQTNFPINRRQAREKELQAAWGGLSLGNSVQPRLPKLERDKAAWIKAEEERRQAVREV